VYCLTSALHHRGDIRRQPGVDSVAVFLDYDGAPTPIVGDADGPALLDGMHATM
jgi:hypothetical protein